MGNPMQSQLNQFREQAAQAGFSGTGILDVHPASGIIRLKLTIPPPANQKAFVRQFAEGLVIMLSGMNISTKIHFAEEE